MTWYDVSFQGQVYVENLTGAAQKTMTLIGIHGYATEAQARAHPQTMNALQGALGGANALAGASGSATNIPSLGDAGIGAGAVAAPVGTAVSSAASVGEFLSRLENPNTWLRIAEVFLGGILLVVAVKSMSDPVTAPVRQGINKVAKSGAWFA